MLALVVAVCTTLSRSLSFSEQVFSLFWPPAGIGFALCWLFGWRGLLATLGGVALWMALFFSSAGGAGFLAAAAGLAASAVGPVVLAWLMQRQDALALIERNTEHGGVELGSSWLMRFYVLQTLVAAPLAAALGTYSLAQTGLLPHTTTTDLFFGYWVVEALGGVLFGPATIVIASQIKAKHSVASLWRATVDAPGLVVVTLVAAIQANAIMVGELAYGRALIFLYFPVLAWCAIRNRGATASVTLVWAVLFEVGLTVYGFRHAQTLTPLEPTFVLLEQSLALFVISGMTQLLQAVTVERKLAYARLSASANLDATTGLLNERGFVAELDLGHDRLALFGLNINKFEGATQLLGFEESQRVLAQTGQRFARLPGVQSVARLDGALFIGRAKAVDGLPAQIDAIAAAFSTVQWPLKERLLSLNTQVVAIEVPAGSSPTAEELLLSMRLALADVGMQPTDNRVRVLDQRLLDSRRDSLQLAEQLRAAISNRQLVLYAQPIVPAKRAAAATLQTRHAEESTLDMEVLIRMRAADGSIMLPGQFLPLAVSSGLMTELDKAVVAQTFAWFSEHPQYLSQVGKCSINLSGVSLGNLDLLEFIEEQVEYYGIPVARFAFEVTESEALSDPIAAVETLKAIRALGFRIALDDFGTGFATYDYLKRFTVDYLKIDGSFIRNIINDPVDQEIVRSVVSVSKRLGLGTIAEFVSSPEIAQFVFDLGVEELQGYAVSQPAPLETIFRA